MDKEFTEMLIAVQECFEKYKYNNMANELLKKDIDYKESKEQLKEIFSEIDKSLASKIDDNITRMLATETELYFREGFKSGVRFILNCMK